MKVFRGVAALEKYLTTNRISFGCLADTGFLYALAYKDDRLFDTANSEFTCCCNIKNKKMQSGLIANN